MNERVRELRKALGLTLAKFGEALGVSNQAISMIESGKNAVTDRMVKAMVHEFNVSEAWLREGAGEMFQPRTRRDEIAAFMGDLLSGPEDFKTRLISVLANLDDAQWALLADMAEQLAETEKAGQD